MLELFDSLLGNVWSVIILLITGFVLLIKGADWLVDGASAVAKRFHVSELVIGLTVVAFGTSMPEFVVNLCSVAEGVTDIAITNILGSNIINIFVILGLTALVYPISSQLQSRRVDMPLATLAGVLALFLGMIGGVIGRWDALILMAVFIVFMYLTLRKSKVYAQEREVVETTMPIGKSVAFILGGLLGLVIGGELIVKSAVSIAHTLGVCDAIIGLTIVALGTSLPELATSVIAATKKNSDLALGNVLGSNIFNVFFVLGVSGLVRPLPIYDGFALDGIMAALGGGLVWLFTSLDKQKKCQRWAGAILLIIYAVYLSYRLWQI